MQKNMAQIIIYELAEQQILENFELSKRAISHIVENWEKEVYVVPPRALRLERAIVYAPKRLM